MEPLAERPKLLHGASWRESDWSTWQRCDEEGKNEFCRRVWPVLFRYASSFGLAEYEAEEIVQDVLILVCIKGLSEWVKDSDKLAACLFRAIRNRALNVKMRKRNHKSLEGSQGKGDDDSASDWSHPVDPQQRLDQQLARSEMRDELDRLIAKLSGNERVVLILKIHMEWGFQRIADVLDLPYGTVRGWYLRALDKLREMPLRL